MLREMAVAVVLIGVSAAAVQAQHAVGVTAVVQEEITVPAPTLLGYAAESGLRLGGAAVPMRGSSAPSRLIDETWVGRAASGGGASTVWQRSQDGMRLEHRDALQLQQVERATLRDALQGEGEVVVVRVVASNS
jgi:hypothetical protein